MITAYLYNIDISIVIMDQNEYNIEHNLHETGFQCSITHMTGYNSNEVVLSRLS